MTRTTVYIFFLILTVVQINGQASINVKLKHDLDSIMVLDQQYRNLMSTMYRDSIGRDSVASLLGTSYDDVNQVIWQKQNEIDSTNLIYIERVFEEFGYPGKSLVGDSTCEVAWYVVQHSPRIDLYFDKIKKAGKKEELPYHLVAMMEDRYLMQQGKCQIYGTQGQCRNTSSGERFCFIWPIKSPKKVNKLREKAGFTSTVEQNAKRLNIDYQVVTLKDVENLKFKTP